MKLLLTVLILFSSLPGFSQVSPDRFSMNANVRLVAKNNKRMRSYENSQLLKIYYYDSGKITMAKGRLLILNKDEVQLLPFGRRDIVTIHTSDISSIGLWLRKQKITAAIIGVTGALAIGGAALMQKSQNQDVRDANFVGFGLVLYSIVVLWYEIIDVPSILLSEEFSVRSEKKGYHFSIETVSPKQRRNPFRIF